MTYILAPLAFIAGFVLIAIIASSAMLVLLASYEQRWKDRIL